jgi:NAD-dependent dihydropyrimidine dehydrogenase PreA subunit
MGQAMVSIVESDCTGCDLCITHCPFEALLPKASVTSGKKRPVIVIESSCVGCLTCIGSCPTGALREIGVPIDSPDSPLLYSGVAVPTEIVVRWGRHGIGIA